jgi:predicted nucleic acid-binding protein
MVPNLSASFLRDWIEVGTFTWLATEEILSEYKGVLSRLGVRRNLVGEIINRLREEAELVTIRNEDNLSPDPDDNLFCACAEQGRASFIATLTKNISPKESDCQGDFAR